VKTSRPHRTAPDRTLLLDLLRGLPEEKVRRDRRAEDSHQRRQGARVRRQARQQRVAQRRRPARTRENGGEDVGEEHSGEPLEPRGERRVRRVHGGHDHDGPEDRHPDSRGEARQHLRGVRHAGEVGGDVEDVGDEQQQAGGVQEPARIVMAHGAGQPAAGHEADPRARELDGRHQGQRHQRRPQHARSERRARHGIGRDAARVVVGSARDEAWAERPKVPDDRVVAVLIRRARLVHRAPARRRRAWSGACRRARS